MQQTIEQLSFKREISEKSKKPQVKRRKLTSLFTEDIFSSNEDIFTVFPSTCLPPTRKSEKREEEERRSGKIRGLGFSLIEFFLENRKESGF